MLWEKRNDLKVNVNYNISNCAAQLTWDLYKNYKFEWIYQKTKGIKTSQIRNNEKESVVKMKEKGKKHKIKKM
jgi:hypothetical protein